MDSLLLVFGISTFEASDCLSFFEVHHVKVLRVLKSLIFFQGNRHLNNPLLIDATEPINQLGDLSVNVLNLDLVGDTRFFSSGFYVVFDDCLGFAHDPVQLLDVGHVTVHSANHHR